MVTESKFTKLGSTLADLEAAWPDRLADAEALLAAGRPAGAIADALYALEIRLKVQICKRLDLEALPKAFETHDLEGLLLLAGLSRRILRRRAALVRSNWDAILEMAEKLNDLRYKADNNWIHQQAAHLLHQVKNPSDGVLVWLSKQR
jgi:hypothetical protein